GATFGAGGLSIPTGTNTTPIVLGRLGQVTTVMITNNGSGYTSANPPTVTFAAPTTGVTATRPPTVDATGTATGSTIPDPGSGYTSANPPMVTFTAPTSGVTATGTATVADTAGLFNSSLLAASGSVTLNIGTNVFISGSMAFSKGGTVTATLSDGSTKQL